MKYALIGCGRIATNHIKAVLNNHLEFAAACDVNPDNIETLDNDLKKAIFASDMELANKLQLDLLITEVADIADIAEDCADELLIFTLKRDI